MHDAFYSPGEVSGAIEKGWNEWFDRYAARLAKEAATDRERKVKMDSINPKYVLRNYMAQLAIDDANKGDYGLIDEIFNLLKEPLPLQYGIQKISHVPPSKNLLSIWIVLVLLAEMVPLLQIV